MKKYILKLVNLNMHEWKFSFFCSLFLVSSFQHFGTHLSKRRKILFFWQRGRFAYRTRSKLHS